MKKESNTVECNWGTLRMGDINIERCLPDWWLAIRVMI
jgi:hypothetical protein